jgi:hypothetical protein
VSLKCFRAGQRGCFSPSPVGQYSKSSKREAIRRIVHIDIDIDGRSRRHPSDCSCRPCLAPMTRNAVGQLVDEMAGRSIVVREFEHWAPTACAVGALSQHWANTFGKLRSDTSNGDMRAIALVSFCSLVTSARTILRGPNRALARKTRGTCEGRRTVCPRLAGT